MRKNHIFTRVLSAAVACLMPFTTCPVNVMAADEAKNSAYVYGTVNLSYADYYYGELNAVAESAKMELDAQDKAAAYREKGMYDAVSSATTSKYKNYATTTFVENQDPKTGGTITGLADVSIAVPTELYNEAKAAASEGKECKNKLLDIVSSMKVSEDVPAEYKVLNGDGTLTATKDSVAAKVVDDATITLANNTSYGHYQISITDNADNASLPDKSVMEGVIIETTDGAKYGMKHLENLWFRTGEIAFAVKDGFIVHNANLLSYERFADITGKTISKVTYIVRGGADVVYNTNLFCKTLLDKEAGYGYTGENSIYADGAKITMTQKTPEDSNYTLASVAFGRNVLTAGTDYTYEENVLTVKNTDKTGIGTYTLTYSDEKYENIVTTVQFTSSMKADEISIADNRLTITNSDVDVTTYLKAVTGVKVNGANVRGNNLGTVIFGTDGNWNPDASVTSHGNTTVLFPEADTEYTIELDAAGYPSVSGTIKTPAYVYGTVNLPYADYYYGELNTVTPVRVMNLEAEDKVSSYREKGMYDAVSSATTNKYKNYATTYYTTNDDETTGGKINGVAGVTVAVPSTLLESAKEAIAENKECKNELLNIVNSFTVSEDQTIPAEYKILSGDGTLTATKDSVAAKVVDDATITLANNTTYGHYQISITDNADNAALPDKSVMEGVVIETTDGAKYGMKHLENLWFRTGEIAFAVKDGFIVHNANLLSYERFADITGKTISKVTYIVRGGADVVYNTNLFCKTLLDKEAGYGYTGENSIYADGAKITMTQKTPEDSNYTLASVVFGRNVLTAGTDYTYEENVLTVKNTDKTGIGTYTLTYSDEKYENIVATVQFTSSMKADEIAISDNALVISNEQVTLAEYIAAITNVAVDGQAVRGMNLGTVIFGEDGLVNLDAKVNFHGTETEIFPEDKEYSISIDAAGYPSVSGTVSKNAHPVLTDIATIDVQIGKTSVEYTGKKIKVDVTVGDLVKGTDYTVSYSDNKNPGTATVTVTGIGNYTGTVTKTFKIKVSKGAVHSVSGLTYKVTSVKAGNKTVAVTASVKTNATSVVIPATVKIGGETYKVSSIGNSAFANMKKLKKVTIGKNIATIGKKSFYNDSKLTSVTIKSTVLKKVGKQAFKNISAKAKYSLPSKYAKSYKKLIDNSKK